MRLASGRGDLDEIAGGSRRDCASTGSATSIDSSHARRRITSSGELSTGARRLLSSTSALRSILRVSRHNTSSNSLIWSSFSRSDR